MNSSTNKIIYFITGASGVGKSTLLNALKKKYRDKPWAFHHFDSIGVPTLTEMEKQYGTGGAWQEVKTHEWIDKILLESISCIFLEGQVNPQFIQDGFQKRNFQNYQIILLDCNEQEMEDRLITRGQPELFTQHMRNWLAFLRNKAVQLNAITIDTSHITSDIVLARFEAAISIS